MAKPTYLWRKLTTTQRENLLVWRKQQGLPWHRPPHRASEKTRYHVTAACFEHRPYIGRDEERMQTFCGILLNVFESQAALIHAWCVLPNHYHALIETRQILDVLAELGRMHGRLSFAWNGEENCRGRQVWCGAAERFMRNDAHFGPRSITFITIPSITAMSSAGKTGPSPALGNIWPKWENCAPGNSGGNIPFSTTAKVGMIRNYAGASGATL